MKEIKTVIAPKGCEDYLTEGKEYKVTKQDKDKVNPGFNIVDDEGSSIFCVLKGCAHINGGNWIIKDSE